jgi:hypothetical protein
MSAPVWIYRSMAKKATTGRTNELWALSFEEGL